MRAKRFVSTAQSGDVIQADIRAFDASPYRGVDIVSGGLPCPPFSVAGKQLGHRDERNLFPAAIRLISEAHSESCHDRECSGDSGCVFRSVNVF